MAFNYSRPKQTAERLIAKFGQVATLRKPGAESGTDWNPEYGEPNDYEIMVVDLMKVEGNQQGSLADRTRRTLLVSTSAGVTPKDEDMIAVGTAKADTWKSTTKWSVVRDNGIRPLAPGGTVLLWEVDLEM